MNAIDPLNVALDRFVVPPASVGLADRIVAATMPDGQPSRRRRDRRGMWRRGRQVLLGSVALGMVSAAAVASGLLGRVGIEVPVLTAMLAPKPVAVVASKPKPRAVVKPVTPTVATPPAVVEAPAVVATVPTREQRISRRVERRERIVAFAQAHPQAAAMIAQRVRQQLRIREEERRALLGFPPSDRAAPDWRPLTPEERFLLRQERRRDIRRVEAMLERRIEARAARQAERIQSPEVSPPLANATESVAAPIAKDE